MYKMIILFLFVLLIALTSCADTEKEPKDVKKQGEKGGICYNDGTCNEGLSCINSIACDNWEKCVEGICTIRSNRCERNSDCMGSEICDEGYISDGLNCIDINECEEGICSENADCINTEGNFSCVCKEGYNGDGLICEDIDECLANNGGCGINATCNNNSGSFTCICNSGFSGNGITCISTMDIYEVTTEEFAQCVVAGGCSSTNYKTYLQDGFCNLNRGGEDYIYSGSDDPNLVAWYSVNSENTTHQVGTKAANGYGLYDMSGNVTEWTNSWYNLSIQTRVLRGCSFDCDDYYSRIDYRYRQNPVDIVYNFGFRCIQN